MLKHLAMVVVLVCAAAAYARQAVPREHPRLLGSLADLKKLQAERPDAYRRMAAVARSGEAGDYTVAISMGIVAAVEDDAELGRKAIAMAMKVVDAPIRTGHVTFGHDLAMTGFVFDLCWPWWTNAQRLRFIEYMNRTVDANVQSETHVFHNAWYGYKNWGYGVAAYACYYENPRAPHILATVEADYLKRAAPALELAGAGGGFAEGYYVHYWSYEWLLFCEIAKRCEQMDYFKPAEKFWKRRAIAGMFEMYPGVGEYGSRRPIPMGDGGGRLFGGDRDKALAARRILVNHYRDDADHQAVHAFNEQTPRVAVGNYAYKDFLWRDTTVKKADLSKFRLSHYSPGPGYVYARSSWDDDATHFFFRCGDRFTAHQHLDVGHFLIYRGGELAGDGGHYDGFGSVHDVNYHLRSIAHSVVLVEDPAETWPGIRAGRVTGNDGGQHHAWRHHNGAAADVDDWNRQNPTMDIADMLAFDDAGPYVYMAGDATRAYSAKKVEFVTRQVVYLRPGTFIIFDRVKSKDAGQKKKWLLQAMQRPEWLDGRLAMTNGRGRLFVQTLLPTDAQVKLVSGADLYAYGGQRYDPRKKTGLAPECRIEVSPASAEQMVCFLHVLTATDVTTEAAPTARTSDSDEMIRIDLDAVRVEFQRDRVHARITTK